MRRYVNIDDLILQKDSKYPQESSITVRRGDTLALEIGVVRSTSASGVTLDIGAGVTPNFRLIAKFPKDGEHPNAYDDEPVVICDTFPKTTIEGQPYYRGIIDLQNDAIDEALGVGEGEDKDALILMAEVSFLYEGGKQTTQKFTFTIQNNLDRDEEGPPPPVASVGSRYGSVAISSGASEVAVTFDTPMPSSTWFMRSAIIQNLVDSPADTVIPGMVTARDENGFTIQLAGETPTANYTLEYVCDAN